MINDLNNVLKINENNIPGANKHTFKHVKL